jgi:hypothetical protein
MTDPPLTTKQGLDLGQLPDYEGREMADIEAMQHRRHQCRDTFAPAGANFALAPAR